MPRVSESWPLRPIAHVRSPFTATNQIPKGPGAEHKAEGVIEVLPEFVDGLLDIEGFSHLYVLWVFDRADGFSLRATPPTDDRPHGVFATRSPRRPNPIGLTVVELQGREGNRLRVRGVDMIGNVQARLAWNVERVARGDPPRLARGSGGTAEGIAGRRACGHGSNGSFPSKR